MIQTITIIQFVFPFILLLAFFYLYKKEYGFMRNFMWKMTMLPSARKLYAYLMVLLLLFINWCCSMTDLNIAVAMSSIVTIILINRRIASSVLHLMHDRRKLWFATLLVCVVSYAIPYMNSIFQILFSICMASVFYPSEKVLAIKEAQKDGDSTKDLRELIIKNYY